MQCCQHCGAKSWAPVGKNLIYHAARPADNAKILICDGCGEWGLKSVIDSSPQPIEFPPSQSPFLQQGPLTLIGDLFKNVMPPAETRLERLVKALLSSSLTRGEIGDQQEYHARSWVSFARAIEKEMDREALLSEAPPPPIADAEFGL